MRRLHKSDYIFLLFNLFIIVPLFSCNESTRLIGKLSYTPWFKHDILINCASLELVMGAYHDNECGKDLVGLNGFFLQ